MEFVVASRSPERGVYLLSSLEENERESLLKKIERGDVPVPPREGALFWGPYDARGFLPPDITGVDVRYIRTTKGVIAILPGEGGELPAREAVWVAEKVCPLFEGAMAAQAVGSGGLLLETPRGTVEISKKSLFWGVLFWDPRREQYIRIEGDNIEKLIDYLEEVVRDGGYKYRPGVNIFFL